MKRIIALLVSTLLIVTLAQAVTLTIIQPEGSVTMTRTSGSRIKLKSVVEGIKWWKVREGNVEVEDGGFVMPNENVSVEPMYTGNVITVIQSDGGKIAPGSVGVDSGGTKTFTITPSFNYTIVDVLVDGESVGAQPSYEFTNITNDHTITAIFSPASSYTVTYNSNGGSGNMEQQTFTEGIAQNLATNTFTRTGYTFKEWNTNLSGTGTSYGNGVSYIATENVTLYAQWTPINYTITYNLDGGTVSGNPTTYTIEDAITLVNPTKDGYNFTGWTGSNGTTPSTTVTIAKGSTGDRTYTANWESAWVGWNKPVLTAGLTPVNWNGSSWVSTTEANWDYNYNSVATATHSTVAGNGDGKWANAQTADGSLYVWIPRYSYKITSGEHAASQKSWNSLDNPGTNKIEVKFSNGTTDDTSNSYIKHPAFTFGTDELKGIWVAKYEASQGNTTSQVSAPTSSTSVAKSIPGVASWRDITVSKMFDYAYNTYRNADSHLMKNVEWGAVAYLTNAIGRIPYVNNSSSYITGNAGGSQHATYYVPGTTNAWDTAGGVKASTTHNVYGIYDMSGGAGEYVSAYVNNGNSNLNTNASSLVNAATKYKDVYPIGSIDSEANNYAAWSSIKGDAVYETSSRDSGAGVSDWDGGGASSTPRSSYPVFRRGGHYYAGVTMDGVFYFNDSDGAAYSYNGFRVVLGIR